VADPGDRPAGATIGDATIGNATIGGGAVTSYYSSTAQVWRSTADRPDARRLVVLHVLDCIGNGIQFSTFALYLNRHSGLSPWTIGLGLAVGGGCGLLSNLVVGRLTDAWGGRRVLATLLVTLGAVFTLLPLVDNLGLLVAFSILYSILHFGCAAPFISLISAAFPASDRARGRALIRSFGNAGMAVGAATSAGLLVLAPAGFLAASPFVNAASFVVAGLIVTRLRIGSRPSQRAQRPPSAGLHAVTSRGMPGMVVATSVLGLHSSLLAMGVPLWISVTRVLPAWTIPLLIGLNTVLVIALQVSAADRAGRSFGSAVTASRVAGCVGAAACAVLAASLWRQAPLVATAALVVGFVLLTVSELLQNGAYFFLSLNLGPDDRRAEYASAFHLTQIVEGILGPLAIGAAFAAPSAWSWLCFAGAMTVAAMVYQRVAAGVQHLAPELAAA
jgi:Major Facilitator Superfamily